jgi:hypothetical protein
MFEIKRHLQIEADHFQFFIEDAHFSTGMSEMWETASSNDLLAVGDGIIAIGIPRFGGVVAVTIEVQEQPIHESFTHWDHVIECSINTISGELVVSAPESAPTSLPKIQIPPGMYEARVYYGNTSSIIDEFVRQGGDHYKIVLTPGKSIPMRVLK